MARRQALANAGPNPYQGALKPHAGMRCPSLSQLRRSRARAPVSTFGSTSPRGGSTGKGSDSMAMPTFTMRQLLEAGVHFGHHTRRWNPKMSSYIFGARNGIHIVDLEQTVPNLHRALQAVRDVAASGGRLLLVATNRQAQEPIADAPMRCRQYFANPP